MMTRQQHKNTKSNNKLFTIGGIVIVLLIAVFVFKTVTADSGPKEIPMDQRQQAPVTVAK